MCIHNFDKWTQQPVSGESGAGLCLNDDAVWGPTCWEKAVSVPANTVYKAYATTLT